MAVSKSPFSKKTSNDTTTTTTPPLGDAGLNPFEVSNQPSLLDQINNITVAGAVNSGFGDDRLKTTVREEKQALDRAYRSALARIARSRTLDEKGKNRARKRLTELYNTGMVETPKPGIFSQIGSEIKSFASNPLAYVAGDIIGVTRTASQGIQSTAKEIADATLILADKAGISNERSRNYVRGGYERGDYLTKEQERKLKNPKNPNEEIGGLKVSWSDWKRQATNPDWRLMPQTGNGFVDWTVDFGIDMYTDPINRIGIGDVRYMGAAGRTELAVKFGTQDMLAKYPQLVGKMAEIGKYGTGAIPKEILEAEGIEYGLRFRTGMNPFSDKSFKMIPKTELMQTVLSGRNGLFTNGRLLTGSAARKLGVITKSTGKFTPAGRLGLKAIGFGFEEGMSDKVVIQEIAQYTAAKTAKGFKSEAYRLNLGNIKDLLEEIRLSNAGEKIYQLVESPEAFAKSTDAKLKDLATRYKAWQDEVRNGVNNIRIKFNTDYGANMKEIGFVDDYLHHKMTDKAFRFAYGPKGQSAKYAGYFKDGDLTSVELGQNTGAAMYRKLRAPEVMPDGSIKYSQFMGEDVVLDDNFPTVIDKVNEIFRRKTGEAYNFFETDIFAIADSYAYSMAAARGREAYIRRLLDYGGDVARIINKKVVPDTELLATLRTSHSGLMIVRQKLMTKVLKTRNLATQKAEAVLKTARQILDEKDTKAFLLDTDIAATTKKLNELETKLNNALIGAAAKSEAERGAFVEIHSVLIDQVRNMRAAIEQGRIDEMVAHDMLKDIFIKMRPDAKRIPRSASELYDTIVRQMGVGDTAELRETTKRLKALQKQLAETPPTNPDELNALLEVEADLADQINGFKVLSDVKQTADYSEDGLLYTTFDNLSPTEFDPSSGDDYVLRTADTRPITSGYGADMTSDEIAALRQAQLTDPYSVAVHAIPTEQMADLRDPAWWAEFWHPESGSADAMGFALKRANADLDDGFKMAVDDLMNHGFIETGFREAFPEAAELAEFIALMHHMEFPEGLVPDDVTVDIFKALHDKIYKVAFSLDPFNAEIVTKQMYDDFLGASVEMVLNRGNGNDYLVNLLLPSRVVHGFDNPMAEDAYSVIFHERYNYASEWGQENITDDLIDGQGSAVMFTSNQENNLMQAIINSDYHTAYFNAGELQNEVIEVSQKMQAGQGLQAEIKAAGGKIGGIKSAGSRRVKAAEKAWKQYQESGLIDIVDAGGKKVKVTVEEAHRILAKSETKLHNKLMAMEDKLARGLDKSTATIQRDIAYHEQRLATLVDQKRVIERWNESTGDALRSEVEALTTAIQTNPPAGNAGTYSRIWSQRVTDRINNIARLEGTGVKDAWERVATQLSADEAKLALYDGVLIPNSLRDIDAASFAGLADDILDGWTAIESTGVQVPKEMADILKPNIEKLRKAATSNAYFNAYKRYNQIFKIYATMTPGFVVRNAYSAAFMNKVAGVENSAIMDGTKAMIAYHKHGPKKWLDVLGITDATDRAIYEEAMRSVMATGRGIQSDFIAPALKGTWGEKLINNKATKLLGNANEFVENSVRFPMALDSMRKGYGYDEAVYRITRYHFDYTDLSSFDETMKNFIPFWVWTTRNLPLQMAEQLIHPQYYTAYKRIQETNPVSSDVMLPYWLSEAGPIGIGGNNVLSPDLPHLRMQSTIDSFIRPSRLLGQANPLVKLLPELILDKQAATGQPFTGKYEKAKGADKAIAWLAENLGVGGIGRKNAEGELEINPKFNYALGNIMPTIGTAQRLTGGAIGGKESYQERALTSWLTAFGIPARNFGPNQQRGEAINRQFNLAKELADLARQGKIQKNK